MFRKLQWLFRREELERDFEEEIRSHLIIEGGADARRAFGNIARIQEETRDAWGWTGIEQFLSDMRHGVRMLRRSLGWTVVMSSTLVLGVGLATAIYSLVYSVLLQPLPYVQPERLVVLWSTSTNGLSAFSKGPPHFNADAGTFREVKAGANAFEDIALVRNVANFNLTGNVEPERLQGARTTFNLPSVLGVQPMLGRTWTEAEDRSDAAVAVLSYGLWERRFGKDPSILGRRIQLNGGPFEVIGVMRPDYRYPSREFELWAPLYVPPETVTGRYNDFNAVGRLRAGVTLAQAQKEASAIMDQDPTAVANSSRLGVYLESFLDATVGTVQDTLWALLEAAGALLLIGCFSLGGLLTARASARHREMSLRAALGANSLRLRRQVVAELLPLSLVGIAGGVALAWVLVRYLQSWLPASMPRTEGIALHPPVLLFSAAVSVMVVGLAAMLPAALASRTSLTAALQSMSRAVTAGGRVREWLVVGQVAATLAILFAAGLLVRSLVALLAVHPGFESGGTLTMHIAVARAKYPKDEQIAAYYERLLARVKTIPSVLEAGFVNRLPLSGSQINPIDFEDRLELGVQRVSTRSSTPGYFKALGIPILQGRDFNASDRVNTVPVGVIDSLMAQRMYPNESPIGKRFRFSLGDFHSPWAEIVGVVGHVHNEGPQQDDRPQVYWPQSQRAQDRAALVVRTTGLPETLSPAIVGRIRAENPDQAVYDIRTMDERINRVLQTPWLLTGVVTAFAGAALLLACLGVYGVVSYNAALRMREFGVRIALGADARTIRAMVMSQASRMVAIGAGLGLLAAWPVGRALQSLLFDVLPIDAISIVAASGVLIGTGMAAALVPAIRAARTNPADTLRGD